MSVHLKPKGYTLGFSQIFDELVRKFFLGFIL